MTAFLCSVGQPTTEICKEQLEKFGFKVVMLDEKEPWEDKYLRFLNLADDDCLRIDADVIPNENLNAEDITIHYRHSGFKMFQFQGYDFYKNNTGVIGIVFYAKEALEIIKKNLDKIDWRRPEATAWRIGEINKHTGTSDDEILYGTHGYFQTKEDLERHKQNKIDRKQIGDYDFELSNKLINL